MPPIFPPSEDASVHTRIHGPIHAEREAKIICIGAGASGLLFAYKLQRSFENFNLTIYEKNSDISGTWLENKYPGCACDIPSHNYVWSFEPKADWSAVYAGADEIYQYFTKFTEKYGLRKYCQFSHKVTQSQWDDEKGLWNVTVTDLTNGSTKQDWCHILIGATGVLNAWKWPNIPGLHDFKGKLMHTAAWDTEADLSGKRVGVIGNGSSAIQVLPAIQPQVASITTFIRGPSWVAPAQGMAQRIYTEEEKEQFAKEPETHLAHRQAFERQLNGVFAVFLHDSEMQNGMRSQMVDAMKSKLANGMHEKLIPTWDVGCRRFTPGVGYLETLGKENVNTVFGEIAKITETGCVGEDGREYPLDVLVCATGFDASFRPRFPLIGLNGKDLAKEWSEEPRSYFGMAAHDFPNYFVMVGPNTPVGNGPVLIAIEAITDYILKFVDRWQTENIHSFHPKVEAIDDFIAHKDQFMANSVWHQQCRSWYKNGSIDGKVTALWPGSTVHFLETVKEVRYDDWNIRYQGNRYTYLGNGYSQVELDNTADWAYYIRNEDDGPFLSKAKQRKVETKSGTMNYSRDPLDSII